MKNIQLTLPFSHMHRCNLKYAHCDVTKRRSCKIFPWNVQMESVGKYTVTSLPLAMPASTEETSFCLTTHLYIRALASKFTYSWSFSELDTTRLFHNVTTTQLVSTVSACQILISILRSSKLASVGNQGNNNWDKVCNVLRMSMLRVKYYRMCGVQYRLLQLMSQECVYQNGVYGITPRARALPFNI